MIKALFTCLLFCTTLSCVAQHMPTTESILSTAYNQAQKEKKNVFVIFSASWCGWCKKMDASMYDRTTKNILMTIL